MFNFIILAVIIIYIIATGYVLIRAMAHYLSASVNIPDMKKINLSEYIPKAGDVILFHPYKHVFINSIWCSSLFSHSGIVINKNSNPHIAEALLEDNKIAIRKVSKNGLNISPLFERIKQYNGEVFVCPLKKALLPVEQHNLHSFFKGLKFNYPPVASIFFSWITGIKNSYKHCFQLTAEAIDSFANLNLSQENINKVCEKIPDLSGTKFSNNQYLPLVHLLK